MQMTELEMFEYANTSGNGTVNNRKNYTAHMRRRTEIIFHNLLLQLMIPSPMKSGLQTQRWLMQVALSWHCEQIAAALEKDPHKMVSRLVPLIGCKH